jgi:dihydrofolate reductase
MRTVTYGAACSLDGFIAARDGAIDWLHFSRDVQGVMAKYWATVDTIVMGRKTWGDAVARAGSGGGFGGDPAMRTYVCSRTLDRIDASGVELVRGDAADFVRALKKKPGKGICVMGGGELAASLLEAGVVDEVGLNVHPILLGAGVPMFGAMRGRVRLALVESRTIDGGCVLATYRVKASRPRSPRPTKTAATTSAAG